jgi:hypothetical protein
MPWLRPGTLRTRIQTKTSDEVLIEKYIGFARELGRFPLEGEIRRKARSDASFPSHSSFYRFGGKQKLLAALDAYCRKTPGCEDVLALCVDQESASPRASTERRREAEVATGFVYLMKSGRHYKIGRTNSIGRRGSELAIKIQFRRRRFTVLKRMTLSESRLTGTSDSPTDAGKVNGSLYRRRT